VNVSEIFKHYAACALWSSTGDDDQPLDADYDLSDIAPETVAAMLADCEKFAAAAQSLIVEADLSPEQIGHDFWLTRNGPGAGFWDRGLDEVGDKLTALCKPFGEVWLYVGDDGLIYS
jgi:hypothetical protein